MTTPSSPSPTTTVPPAPRWPHLVALLTCGFFVLVLYANTLHGPAQYDDRHTFARQSYAQVLDQAWGTQFPRRVVVNVTFIFNYWLGGVEPFGYHVLNMAVHALTGFCLFGLLYALLRPRAQQAPTCPGLRWIGDRQAQLALAAALLFLCHPLATQAVSYISQRYTSIASLFCVLALWAYCRARRLRQEEYEFTSAPHLGWYATAVLAGLAAMYSKEFPIALPGLVLLLEFTLLQPNARALGPRLLYALPLLLTALVIPLVYHSSTQALVEATMTGGAAGGGEANGGWAPASISRTDYFKTQCAVVPFIYLRLLLWPIGLALEHAQPLASQWVGLPGLGALCLAVLLLVGLLACRWAPFIGVGVLWLLGTLVPTSSVLPNNILVAEHRMYLPMMGLAFVAVGLVHLSRPWWSFRRLVTATVGLILALSTVTVLRNRVWADPRLLWADTIAKTGGQASAHFGLGYEYEASGHYPEALREYDEALRLSPLHIDALHNRGNVLHALGRREDAVAAYRHALEVNPRRAVTWCNLAIVLGELGRQEESLIAAHNATIGETVTAERGVRSDAHNAAGLALQRLGRLDEARAEYRLTLEIDAGNVEATFNLGLIAYAQGDQATALQLFSAVVQAQPDHARALIGYGSLLAYAGRLDQAAAVFQHTSSLDSPQRLEAYLRLGRVRVMQHDWPAAITALQAATTLAPQDPAGHQLLAEAYTGAGDSAAAQREALAAQRLAPAAGPAPAP